MTLETPVTSAAQPAAAAAVNPDALMTAPRKRRVDPLSKPKSAIANVLLWILLIGFSALFIYPFAWLLFVIIMIATFIQIKFGNKFVYYEGGK